MKKYIIYNLYKQYKEFLNIIFPYDADAPNDQVLQNTPKKLHVLFFILKIESTRLKHLTEKLSMMRSSLSFSTVVGFN